MYENRDREVRETMDIAIIGAGGHGRVVLDIIRAAGSHHPIGFIDGNQALKGHHVDGLAVLGDISQIGHIDCQGVVIAIGDNGIRRQYAEMADHLGMTLVNAIHPSANIASSCTLGQNVVIAAGSVVCAHCQIGNSAILNTACIVDHESIIGTAAHICPGARLAGRTIVEAGAFVGIGASVIQAVRIGADAIVGAGAVVIRDVPQSATVVGVPAKIIKGHPSPAERFDSGLEEQLATTI